MGLTTLTKELEDNVDLKEVKNIQFGLFSPELIRKGSVVEVVSPVTYEGTEPKIGGLFDPRMGIIERGRKCATCGHYSDLCPGHFGHIELAIPVFFFQYINYILKILRCVCFRCSNLLVDKSDPKILEILGKKTGQNRFNIISKLSEKVKKCEHNNGCMIIQPKKYEKVMAEKTKEKNSIVKLIAHFSQDAFKDPTINLHQNITPTICYDIFKKITNADVEFIGFNPKNCRPEWMICKVLPVPPPSVRPSVRQDNNQRSEDDLTVALIGLLNKNNSIKNEMESGNTRNYEAYQSLLQFYIATYINNDITGIPPIGQRSNRPLKAIVQRLKGKEGRFRGNIMGKRTDFSGRTVITVDPNISINEYGVPYKIAMNLTFPEIVTEDNMDDLYKLVRNGPNKHPGAKSIEKLTYDCYGQPAPCIIYLKHIDVNTVVLNPGDIVHRHLQDGDINMFNRQPSLHKMSMMAHKTRVLPFNTFRLNVTVTKPYNADFDGDEMNTFIIQSLMTRYELEQICLVSTQIISPATSSPIIQIVQDTMIGTYLFTYKVQPLRKLTFNNLMMYNPTFNINSLDKQSYTGHETFSTILPNDVNYKNMIINGELVKGVLDSKVMAKTLTQSIFNMYGPQACQKFLDNTQDLITRWLESHSFSIGYGDCLPSKKMTKDIDIFIDKQLEEVELMIKSAQQGVYEDKLDERLLVGSMETDISKYLESGVNAFVPEYMEANAPITNSIKQAVLAGSKGKWQNMAQILGAVGQQVVWKSRIPNGFTQRTLPHYAKTDYGAFAKGFIRNSYIKGLKPTEFFFHAMAGRTGNIDTAINTAQTGYISRKFMKAMEDLKLEYDGTVRNSNGNIIQFMYGEDNFDPIKLEINEVRIVGMSNETMRRVFYYDEVELKNMTNNDKKIVDEEFVKLQEIREQLRKTIYVNLDVLVNTPVLLPVKFHTLINSVKNRFHLYEGITSDLTPEYVIQQTDELIEKSKKYNKSKVGNTMLETLIRTNLASKKIIVDNNFNKMAFDYLTDLIYRKILISYATYGELVGPIAAQSLGEPSTQLTLNTFHKSGSRANVTSGVPRLKEIIDVSKTPKVSVMNIYLKDGHNETMEKCNAFVADLQYTKIGDMILESHILYDETNDDRVTNIEEDVEFIKTYNEFNKLFGLEKMQESTDGVTDCINFSRWILRLIFDREQMMHRNIIMSDIQEAILKNIGSEENIQCVFSDDNSGDLIMRIRIKNDMETDDYIYFLDEFENAIKNITIRGVPGIEQIYPIEYNKVKYNADSSAENSKLWRLDTEGTNLITVFGYDYVDTRYTITNNIVEVWQTLGIEAVRNLIVHEIRQVFNETPVNYRHVSLLADMMTSRGSIMPINRFGINKSNEYGPITKTTFEQMDEMIMLSSIFGQTDNMKSVASNITMGQTINAGTNSFEIYLDETKLKNNSLNINESIATTLTTTQVEKDIESVYDNYPMNLMISQDDFQFGYDIEDKLQSI